MSKNVEIEVHDEQNVIRMPGSESVFLLPEELEVEEIGDRMKSDTESDFEKIHELAESIKQVGQEQPCKVVEKKDGTYRLTIGRRRMAAIATINAERDPKNPLKVWCVVDRSGGDSFQKAVIENVHRKNYSPIEMANIFTKIRKQHKWEGGEGTAKVADYLKISPATVTQYERVNKELPHDKKMKVHKGEWTMEAALEYLNTQPEKAEAVEKRAEQIAQEEAAKTPRKTKANAEKNGGKTNGKAAAAAKPKVGGKHVRQAQQEMEAQRVKKAPGKAEVREFFQQFDSADYGYGNSPVRTFVKYFVDKWMAGNGSDKTLQKLFDGMVCNADGTVYEEGSPSKAEQQEQAQENGGNDKPKKTRKKAA